jgi:hypothetical protein
MVSFFDVAIQKSPNRCGWWLQYLCCSDLGHTKQGLQTKRVEASKRNTQTQTNCTTSGRKEVILKAPVRAKPPKLFRRGTVTVPSSANATTGTWLECRKEVNHFKVSLF